MPLTPEQLAREGIDAQLAACGWVVQNYADKRDKLNLDIFWLKDEALEESANLPPPDVIAAEIAADLEAALEQFATIAEDLK